VGGEVFARSDAAAPAPAGRVQTKKRSLSRQQLDPELPPGAAVKHVLLPLFDIMRNNEHAVRSGDSDGLHDFRVASRRSRVVLSRAKNILSDTTYRRCRKDLRWLAKTTNQSRDLDVGLVALVVYRSTLPPKDANELRSFEHDLHERQCKAYDQVRAALDSDRYRRFTTDYRALLTTSTIERAERTGSGTITDVASGWVWAAYQRVLKRGRACGPTPSVRELHKLRLACKRLRYLMEVYESLFSKQKIAELIDTLEEFQTLLGDLLDFDLQRHGIEEFIRKTTASDAVSAEAIAVMNQFAEELENRVITTRLEFCQRFDAFARPSNEWGFRELFQTSR
jgi:CHAD domain-containing protein